MTGSAVAAASRQDEPSAAVAVVDFSNLCPAPRSDADVYDGLHAIDRVVREAIKQHWPRISELHLRLYGGWLFRNGRMTRQWEWALPHLADFRTRRDGLRVEPELAHSSAWHPSTRIVGTFRTAREADFGRPAQKMVDGLIVADSLRYSLEGKPTVLVSDDDDVLPGLLAAAARPTRRMIWLRKRAPGQSCNDQWLTSHSNIEICHAPGWPTW
ncbi:hypothetical protein ACFC0N_22275 [Streptomyces zaomyceticus]|uniref:hypothetical protein n=1 Tax=Streptomyces zaomyceticus TaxID=68286 RepID=UPI0035E1D44E